MSDEQFLLAAILANPADDTARLVYADWLEENGQRERAEFIRVQIELAKIGCSSCVPSENGAVTDMACECQERAEVLRRREESLWRFPCYDRRSLHSKFLAEFEGWKFIIKDRTFDDNGPFGLVSRGFVSALTCSWPDWSRHAAAILERQPVERVTLTTHPDPWHKFIGYTGKVSERHKDGYAKLSTSGLWTRIVFELPDGSNADAALDADPPWPQPAPTLAPP